MKMTRQMKQKNATKLSFLQFLGLTIIDIPVILYSTLLYKIVWGWFFVERFFEVGYWELFLGLVVLRFMVAGAGANMNKMRLEKELGSPSFEEWITHIFTKVFVNTVFFGILYIINLMINYYS